jgi:outer membrane protein OmpA-like peptidoglycan-associated protein
MKVNRKEIVSVILGLALTGATGCGILSDPTQREQSAGIGALAGGVGGAIIGSFTGAAVTGGLFGMPLGALAGYYIGDQWLRDRGSREARDRETDRELAQLRQENERLKRLAEGSEQQRRSALAPAPESEQETRKTTKANVSDLPADNLMIGFDVNKSSLNSAAQQTLSPIATWLKGESARKVSVVGYADSTGSDSYNVKLSERRAKAVKDFLVESGASADKITTRGMGEANPIAKNDNEAGREKNRRVEIIPNDGMSSPSVTKAQ